ncbi:transposase [Rhodococcus sp. WAY2]|uniref:transposase n=1 Tax=Rhodococcus sp. WAY2 TaxID=2663121 RepID=UPI001F3C847D|nr:transposase [Rhodococcus sp. WAY2]
MCGIGTLNAGKILARVGSIHRFRSAAAFASYTGTAPICSTIARSAVTAASIRAVVSPCAVSAATPTDTASASSLLRP